MAQNNGTQSVALTVPTAENFRKIMAWENSLPQDSELRAKIPSQDSDNWFEVASQLMLDSMKPEEAAAQGATGKRTRSAVHYTTLILSQDGTYEVLGSGFGPVGREPLDPKKFSDSKKLQVKADVRVVRDSIKGIASGALTLPTKELPDFMGIEVPEAPEGEEDTAEATTEG